VQHALQAGTADAARVTKPVPLFVVDAFTSRPFGGNQAAVCLLPPGPQPPEPWMQSVAAEMGYSETAFVRPAGGVHGLRWFTPSKEVPLCGHATLASALVLWEQGILARDRPAVFDTLSGRLTCVATPDGIAMDFPADAPHPREAPAGLFSALGCRPGPVFEGRGLGNLMVVLETEAEIRSLAPDMAALRRLSSTWAYIVTAPSSDGEGYVCRYFAPAWGIDEDPATGSIHCTLGPYWAQRLGKASVRCRQLSRRGAEMVATPKGDRVIVCGNGVITLRGELLA
jgi:PhzF family phenazine biosynthesis protein